MGQIKRKSLVQKEAATAVPKRLTTNPMKDTTDHSNYMLVGKKDVALPLYSSYLSQFTKPKERRILVQFWDGKHREVSLKTLSVSFLLFVFGYFVIILTFLIFTSRIAFLFR